MIELLRHPITEIVALVCAFGIVGEYVWKGERALRKRSGRFFLVIAFVQICSFMARFT